MASLMEPTISRFKQGDYSSFNQSIDTAYPDPITYHRTLRLTARRSMLGVQTTLSGGRQVRWTADEATSIEPTSFVDNVLEDISGFGVVFKSNETVSVTLPVPVTTVTCITPGAKTVLEPNDDVYYIMKDGVSVGALGSISSLAHRVNGSGVPDNYTYYTGSKIPSEFQRFNPVWLNAPEPDSPALIVVLFSWKTNATEPQSLDQMIAEVDLPSKQMPLEVVTCRVSAYWNTAQATLIWNQGVRLPTETGPIAELEPRDVRNITLNTTGIDMLHSVEFARVVRYRPHIDLAVRFGLTISNLPHFFMLRSTYFSYYDERKQWGYNLTDFKDTVKVTDIETNLYAYGYTTHSTSVRLSLAVILAYCIVTVTYLVYILITGSTSTAWNSAIELVALALQSKKPDYPGCTAVGIDSLNTFKQGVGIRVNGDNELELVFASDRDLDVRGLRKIEKNVAY
jgi:hypothetical protein